MPNHPTTPELQSRPGRWSFVERPGAWLWALVAIGLAGRLWAACNTAGTADVQLWTQHASLVWNRGLAAAYATRLSFNHPPPIGWAMAQLFELALALDVPFRVLYRALIGVADLGNAWLIACILRESRWRWVALGAYCVAPLAILLSAQHGNTDVLVALCLLGAVLAAARQRAVWTGVLLGLSAWIKLPGLLAAPALGCAFARRRDACVCAAVALAVAAAPFVWTAPRVQRFAQAELGRTEQHANPLWTRVIAYQGTEIRVTGEEASWLWGLRNFTARAFGPHASAWPAWARWWHAHDVRAALLALVVFAWLRRREHTARELAVTVAGSYALFYALIDNWATQYLAWSLPFWLIAGWRFALAANLTAGAFVYALYANNNGDWLLRAPKPHWSGVAWPPHLFVLRDLALLTFLVFGVVWFARAVRAELAAWTSRAQRSRL